jgi:hypothetical protein
VSAPSARRIDPLALSVHRSFGDLVRLDSQISRQVQVKDSALGSLSPAEYEARYFIITENP